MFKKILSLMLVLVLTTSICVFQTSADSNLYGDVDKNGIVEATDALEILKYVVGKKQLSTSAKSLADVDDDGRITSSDALEILKKVVGKIKRFPVEGGKASRVLTVAIEPYFYPYSWEENGEFYGLDVDVAKELASRNGFDVEFVFASWDDWFSGIADGTYNLILGVEPTSYRQEFFVGTDATFTDEYYDGMAAVFNLNEFDISFSEWSDFKYTIRDMLTDGTITKLLDKYNLLNTSEVNAYEYLKDWVITNGTSDGETIEYIYDGDYSDCYGFLYNIEYDYLSLWHFDSISSDIYAYTSLDLDTNFYGFSFYGDRIYGYLDAETYSDSTTLTYSSSYCSIYKPKEMLSTAKTSIDLLLTSCDLFLLENYFPFTIYDLGFKSF